MAKRMGKYTVKLENPPSILASASIGSEKEKNGPLGGSFDLLDDDSYFGQDSWEKAESYMQTQVVQKALEKAGLKPAQIDCIFAGDLLNQCVGSSYGLRGLGIPFMGLYGACSTMAESLVASSVFIEAGAANRAVACTSSHFCAAERQYRFPLEYGGQRTPTAQWTATAAGAAVLSDGKTPPFVRGVCVGTIEDMGVTDANNMGAAMAPAAAATLTRFFDETNHKPKDFDLVITGDLGLVGSRLLRELMEKQNYPVDHCHTDCGLMLYDREKQDAHAGGSGCGCGASVMCGHIMPLLRDGVLKNVLFVATGALLSPTVVQQGESIASIAHLVYLSNEREGGLI